MYRIKNKSCEALEVYRRQEVKDVSDSGKQISACPVSVLEPLECGLLFSKVEVSHFWIDKITDNTL